MDFSKECGQSWKQGLNEKQRPSLVMSTLASPKKEKVIIRHLQLYPIPLARTFFIRKWMHRMASHQTFDVSC